MKSILGKLMLIQKFNNFNDKLKNLEKHVNKININYNSNDINNKLKTFVKISAENKCRFDKSEDKANKCENCDKLFEDKYSLNSHKCSQTKQRQFECDFEDCDKIFKFKYLMNNHKKKDHYGMITFECYYNNCDKIFFNSHHLKQHLRRKHSID